MTRLFKLKTSLLALILSAASELVFVVAFFAFRSFSEFGTPLNFVSSSFWWFHFTALEYLHSVFHFDLPETWCFIIVGFICFFGIALIQWYLIFFVSITLIRFFTKRQHEDIGAA